MTSPRTHAVVSAIEHQVAATFDLVMRYPWEQPKKYANWLAQTNYYVRRVTHVLAAAASRTPIGDDKLHVHFLRGITEERDHDALAIADLRALGFEIAQFPEHPLVKAYYQTLFYMIERVGPAAVIGYFLVLEGSAGVRGNEVYERVTKHYSERATTFLKEHIVHDADHYPNALKMLDLLDDAELAIVHESAELGGPIYRYLVEAIRNEGTG